MKTLYALLRKDLRIELRTLESLSLMVFLSLLLSVVIAFGIQASFLPPASVAKLFPSLIWIVMIFTATVSIERSYAYELENSAIEALLVAGIPLGSIFVAKALTVFVMVFVCKIVCIGALAVLLNITVMPVILPLLGIACLVVMAYSLLATLLAAISARARLRSLLLPMILLPLLFPLIFSAVELSSGLFASSELDTSSPWFTLLLGLNFMYFFLGLGLYEHVIRE